jgi:hypothetical protein
VIDLQKGHPATRAVGACVILGNKLKGMGQVILGIICRDAQEAAVETRDLVREIGTDAANLSDVIDAAAADNVVTAEELAGIRALALEIQHQAATGQIVPGSAVAGAKALFLCPDRKDSHGAGRVSV